jgi:hypothetical protein
MYPPTPFLDEWAIRIAFAWHLQDALADPLEVIPSFKKIGHFLNKLLVGHTSIHSGLISWASILWNTLRLWVKTLISAVNMRRKSVTYTGSSYMNGYRYTDTQVCCFFNLNSQVLRLLRSLAPDIQGLYIILWYVMMHFYCKYTYAIFCVYVEIVLHTIFKISHN